MQRSRLAFLFALALIPSACEFRGCGLGCGSNASSNIPATPSVKPQPLAVPDPLPGEHGLAAAWFDNAEGLVAWAKSINPEKFPKEISVEGLREIIVKQTGSPQLASRLDLTRPFGCVGFNVMEFMQGQSLPLSCVFHFKGGLDSLETALSASSPKKDGDQLLVSVQGRDLAFQAWPSDDAIWLTGGKKLAMQAKPVLEQKLAGTKPGQVGRVELSLYVAQILGDYKVFLQPMLKSAIKDFSAGLPLGSAKVDETIDKTFNELQNLHEVRVSFRGTESESQVYFSETMAAESEQLRALDKAYEGPGIDPHLLGLLPDSSVWAAAQKLNLAALSKQVWTKESHEVLGQMVAAQTGQPFPHSYEEVSTYIHETAEHFEGNAATSIFMFGPKEGAMVLLYEPKAGQSPRAFWSKGLKAIAPHFKEHVNFDGSAKQVTVQGVEFDRYQATSTKAPADGAARVFVLDIGELDGVGIIAATDQGNIETATKTIVAALQGQGRFGDTPGFSALASKFAGNHMAMAADFFGVMNANPNKTPKAKTYGLGDISVVMRGAPGKGVAVQMALANETLKAISKEAPNALR